MITRRVARPFSTLSSLNWVCPSCSRASLVQNRLPHLQQRRRLHKVAELGAYDQSFKKDGVPGLFSPTGFSIAWTSYQAMIIQKLNELTAGEEYENQEPKKLIIRFARDPMAASLFNHASMAFNNHFFFQTLSTSPLPIESRPDLRTSLEKTFGSIDTLRTTMLDTAAAMFGPGFVWLVWMRHRHAAMPSGEWRILSTYLAGTPFPEAGFRYQGVDMNTSNAKSFGDYMASDPVNSVGYFGASSKHGKELSSIPPGGTTLVPVLCVNTWEHVYIYDFGIPGKRKFLADWWAAVDWGRVAQLTPSEEAMPSQYAGNRTLSGLSSYKT